MSHASASHVVADASIDHTLPPLTPRQLEVLHFIRLQIEAGPRPTVRLIAGVFGVAPAAVMSYLEALARKGYVRRIAGELEVLLAGTPPLRLGAYRTGDAKRPVEPDPPTPEEIEDRAAAIRSTWSEAERRRRARLRWSHYSMFRKAVAA